MEKQSRTPPFLDGKMHFTEQSGLNGFTKEKSKRLAQKFLPGRVPVDRARWGWRCSTTAGETRPGPGTTPRRSSDATAWCCRESARSSRSGQTWKRKMLFFFKFFFLEKKNKKKDFTKEIRREISHVLFECGRVRVNHGGHHVVDERQVGLDILRGPVAEKAVEQTLITPWKARERKQHVKFNRTNGRHIGPWTNKRMPLKLLAMRRTKTVPSNEPFSRANLMRLA